MPRSERGSGGRIGHRLFTQAASWCMARCWTLSVPFIRPLSQRQEITSPLINDSPLLFKGSSATWSKLGRHESQIIHGGVTSSYIVECYRRGRIHGLQSVARDTFRSNKESISSIKCSISTNHSLTHVIIFATRICRIRELWYKSATCTCINKELLEIPSCWQEKLTIYDMKEPISVKIYRQ